MYPSDKTILKALSVLVIALMSQALEAQPAPKDPGVAQVTALVIPAGDYLYRGQIAEFLTGVALITAPAILGNNIGKYCYQSSYPVEKRICRTNPRMHATGWLATVSFHLLNVSFAAPLTREWNQSQGFSIRMLPEGPAFTYAFGRAKN